MGPDRPQQNKVRRTRFEVCEDRLVMSAQPLADFFLAPQPANSHVAADAARNDSPAVSPLSAAHDLTGLTSIRGAYGFGGGGQTVAVIDTGIAFDHHALGGGFGSNYRVVGGWDFAEKDAVPYDDGAAGGHGTHVAGIIGSNHALYPGVAPDVDLVALRVFADTGGGYFNWIEDALSWVHDHRLDFENPITTVNLSLGAEWNDDTVPSWASLEDEFAQLEEDGIFVAVAAGNSFHFYGEPGLNYPAVSSHVVPVSSVDADGTLSYYSQRHNRVIAAPGRDIMSTVPDYRGDGDGVTDDFERMSGTSMATPYVAGASVLMRQAFAFAGNDNVSQDELYGIMRETADSVWDAKTGQYYSRLNLAAALDRIMPADQHGSTVATAYPVGALTDTLTVSGAIERLNDVDYFRFTATQSGVAHLALGSDDAMPSWMLGQVEGGVVDANHVATFDVVAGQQYVVGVKAGDGVAHYEIDVDVEAEMAATDWGTIFHAQFQNQNVSGGATWYQVTAGRSGYLTVQAWFSSFNGNVDVEIYDSNNRLVDASRSSSGSERVDVIAGAGDVFFVKVVGRNTDVDFEITNLVELIGNNAVVHGTEGADVFGFRAGHRLEVSVNGVAYQLDGARSVMFHGGTGADEIRMTGGAGADLVVLRPGSAWLAGAGYQAGADNVENIQVDGGGGNDTAQMFDSHGDDRLVMSPGAAILDGAGFANSARGFGTIYALATAGGHHDRALFYDSPGNDRFIARPDWARMDGGGFYNYSRGFDVVAAYATGGGADDQAFFYDSAGRDRFEARPDWARMAGNGFSNLAQGFDRVYAYATAGGHGDEAYLFDSAGDDTFIARSTWARMQGSGFYNYVNGFGQVYAHADGGGIDHVLLLDVHEEDQLFGRDEALQYASGYGSIWTHYFEHIRAVAASGHAPSDDVRAVDYVFERAGDWS